jgi:hypothetical protein
MYAASVVAAAGILAGCTGNALQSTPSNPSAAGAAFQNGHMTPLAAIRGVVHNSSIQHHGDWISPDKKKKKGADLYISDAGTNEVYIYNYTPGNIGSQVGTISSGLSQPQGMCSDKKGDVWVTNTNDVQVLEYAHGSTTQKGSLATTGYYPAGCAIFKKSGDLAVTGICNSNSCGMGALLVFAKAKGTAKTYTCSDLYRYYFDGYDKKGNLFVDGENESGGFGLCELKKGSSTLTNISVSSPPSFPGGVSWDGKYLAVGDQLAESVIQYSVSGTTATEQGTVSLNGASDVVQYTIAGNYLIGPDAGNAAAEVWKYPAGGSIVDSVTGLSEPIGSTISK